MPGPKSRPIPCARMAQLKCDCLPVVSEAILYGGDHFESYPPGEAFCPTSGITRQGSRIPQFLLTGALQPSLADPDHANSITYL